MDHCAHTFERRAIQEWLAQHGSCPISRKPTSEQDLTENCALAERMDRWKWEQENATILQRVVRGETAWPDDSTVEALDVEAATEEETNRKDQTRSRYLSEISKPVYPVFMLLPQEEAMMQLERLKQQEREQLRRNETRRCILWSVLALLALILVSYFLNSWLVFPDVEDAEVEEAADQMFGITDDIM